MRGRSQEQEKGGKEGSVSKLMWQRVIARARKGAKTSVSKLSWEKKGVCFMRFDGRKQCQPHARLVPRASDGGKSGGVHVSAANTLHISVAVCSERVLLSYARLVPRASEGG